MTYTKHKLTDAQLCRLSAIVNATKGAAKHGTAGDALKRKGLVIETGNHYDAVEATDAGRDAMAQARREGW